MEYSSLFRSFGIFFSTIVLMCMLSVPAYSQEADQSVIAPDFRGQIIYEGSYEGSMETPRRIPRNLNVGSILNAVTASNSEPYRGSIRYVVEFEGNIVRGTFQEQGSFNGSGTFTGTRQGELCSIVSNAGVRINANCNFYTFSGSIDFTDNRNRRFRSSIEANKTSLIDYVERDRQRAIEAENARIAAAEAAARYAALPSASPALVQRFDRIVQTDAQGWAFNRYDVGSMRNVKIISGQVGRGTYVIRGEYTYNGGQTGWVMAEMSGQNLSCIQFWDAVMGCRGLRTPEQGQAMREAFVEAITNPSTGVSSSSDWQACMRANELRAIEVPCG